MTAQQLSAVFQSAIGLVVLLTMFLIWVPSLRLDLFRQKMFALRDELFDYAGGGKLQFDHPAYLLLRKSLNGFIRYGHRLSFFQICITFCRWRVLGEKPTTEWGQKWAVALGSIEDEQVRADLLVFQNRAMTIVINRLILGSPLLLFTFVVTIVILGIRLLLKGAWNSMAEVWVLAAIKTFEAFAIDPNALEDEALRSASTI